MLQKIRQRWNGLREFLSGPPGSYERHAYLARRIRQTGREDFRLNGFEVSVLRDGSGWTWEARRGDDVRRGSEADAEIAFMRAAEAARARL